MRTCEIETWSFLLADEREAWRKNFDDSTWRTVTVPHDWSVELDFDPACSSGTGYLPGGTAWYRGHVSLKSLDMGQGRRLLLVFHGVQRDAQVWVNGYHLGGRPSGYAEFAFDLTEVCAYAPDDDLVVCVRVNRDDESDSRWYNGSGLTRRVELEVREPVDVAPHGTSFTTLATDTSSATVRITSTLGNHTDAAVAVAVSWELTSQVSGRTESFHDVIDIPARATQVASASGLVAGPDLWSDEQPGLYRLVTTLEHPEGTSRVEEVVGLRTVVFDPDHGVLVNGERRTLRGVCLHEDAGCLGTAVPAEVWLRRLVTLKQAGCNAVRMAHNPHAPEIYTLCDQLGLFVIDEAFDEWENPKNKWWQGHNVYPPRHGGPAKHFPEWHERDLVAMVQAHRNHPSIIAWSIGNEIDYPNDPYASPLFAEMVGNNDADKPASERVYDPDRPDVRRLTTICNRLVDIVKGVDDSRPVTLAAAFPELSSLTGLLDPLDVIGYNYKESLYPEHQARFPLQAFLGSENSHGYEQWQAVIDHDYVAGQFLWTGVDYLGEARGWPVHGSPAGLLTVAGYPKEQWHLRRSWWSGEPVAHLVARPAADPGDGRHDLWARPPIDAWQVGDSLELLCFTNADEVCVMVEGREVRLVWDPSHGWWSARVTGGSGPFTVRVRHGDTETCEVLHPRGDAMGLVATPWVPPQSCAGISAADDPAIHQVEIMAVDAAGRRASGDVVVRAVVEGGELLGLENGDLADATGYARAERSTHDGRLLAYVRGEDVELTLQADGLSDLALRMPGPSIPKATLAGHG
ncbi:glycoside hydrolase family 2 TIM barrel-domain containing protein [Propioniciclava soli]|uniref:glycoside hydrolase family 2 TIM barrel-domain containing protein n=1 Tax=Propioniciclava soli TaxID=2775081 RepID=UPI001E307EFA|nr:glycoside hydrolase family 2 TIM barrel-domain containing protein [Propioniciclava soli]